MTSNPVRLESHLPGQECDTAASADLVARLLAEGTQPLLQAIKSAGLSIPYQKALRWVRNGVAGHRLEAIKAGGQWRSTPEAVRRFIAQATRSAAHGSQPAQPVPKNPATVAQAKSKAIVQLVMILSFMSEKHV